jgi:hypothetical protein
LIDDTTVRWWPFFLSACNFVFPILMETKT